MDFSKDVPAAVFAARRSRKLLLLAAAGVMALSQQARAIITFGGTGTNAVPAPGNVDQYEGIFNGSYAGTAISPNFMVTATHLTPGPTSQFIFNNGSSTATTYNIQLVATLDDVALWQIAPNQNATFSTYVPIFTGSNEAGSALVDLGRGYTRGPAVTGGWSWSGVQGPLSWGSNTVSAIATDKQLHTGASLGGDFLAYPFANQNSNSPTYDPNEGIITPFDSGGGVFINNAGQYQLAGVNSLVDNITDVNGNTIQASLYDTNGYYNNNSGVPVPITTDTPQNSYASRISSRQNFIGEVTGSISPASAAANPVSQEGLLAVYSNTTLGAITGNGSVQVGSTAVTATLQIAPNSGVSQIAGISVYKGSTFDITNNTVIINGADIPSEESWLLKKLASACNGGLWNGVGITSSTAAASPLVYGVGFAPATDASVLGLLPGQVELKYTLDGDCNLDGRVNGADFAILAANFNKAAPDGWADGDFYYTGSVNGGDFALLVNNFNKSSPGFTSTITASDLSAISAFMAANGLSQANLPEPGGLIALAAGAALLKRRRHP